MSKKENKKSNKIIFICILVISIILIGILISFLITKNNNNFNNKTISEKESSTTIDNRTTTTIVTEEKKDEIVESKDKKLEVQNNKEKSKNNNKLTTTTSKATTNKTSTLKTSTTTTTKQTTTEAKKSTTTTTTTTKRTKVKEEKVEETENLETKYGVKRDKVIKYNVITYSDSTTEKKKISESIKYDYSGYNANTNDLKKEAKEVMNNNMSTYKEVVVKVNEYRADAQVNPITLDNDLCLAATIRAMELAYANKFSHTRPNGTLFYTVLNELKIPYSTAGENIAAGQTTVSAVTKSWYNSQGHRANMENKNFNKIGVGKYKLPYSNWGTYWVQIFTN